MEPRAAWLEYRVASQFAETWGVVEETLATRWVLSAKAPPPEAEPSIQASRKHVSPRWIEEVEIPHWFRRHELGGEVLADASTNIDRAVEQMKLEARLEREARRRKAKA